MGDKEFRQAAPVITFWQTAADMALSTGVPAGHGHVYGADPVDAWAAIYTPPGWTEADNRRLRSATKSDTVTPSAGSAVHRLFRPTAWQR